MNVRRLRPGVSWSAVVVIVFLVGGCYQPSRLLTIASSPDIVEGQRTLVTITVQNTLPHAIIPVSMTLYERRDHTEEFGTRRFLAEREFLAPLQAAKVRHLGTLNRVEADQVRDAGVWRRVPDTRFLHPRIMLPGQSFAQTCEFQAIEAHRRRLYCDLYYFRLDSDEIRGRLFARDKTMARRRDPDHYTEVFTLVDPAQLAGTEPKPQDYLLYRRHVPRPQATRIVTKRVPLNVRPRPFSFREAAARARFAHRAHTFFTAAEAWVFDYDDGTWFVAASDTVKLRGRYVKLIFDLESKAARTLSLTAPRRKDDKLLELFHKFGYSDPKAKGKTARATIPTDRLLEVLKHAEALGYLIDSTTWRPLPKAP